MFKKSLSLFSLGLLFCAPNLQTISAQSSTDNSADRNKVEKIKTAVYRHGIGEKSKVVVKMKNGTNLKGFISQTGDDSFDLTNSKTKRTTSIAYSDVGQVKKQGLSTGAKIAIGVGIGVAITAVVLAVAVRDALDDWGTF